jgi:hypothetical protein
MRADSAVAAPRNCAVCHVAHKSLTRQGLVSLGFVIDVIVVSDLGG